MVVNRSEKALFLFKFDTFRADCMKKNKFDESVARSQGFKLNKTAESMDNFLHENFPRYFSNLITIIAEKQ